MGLFGGAAQLLGTRRHHERCLRDTAAFNDLCAELRPHAQTLVDAFAIAGPFLGAAMLAGTPGGQAG